MATSEAQERVDLIMRYGRALKSSGYPPDIVKSNLNAAKHIPISTLREYVQKIEARLAGQG